MADRSVAGTISVEVATMSDEFIWVLQDTAAFIAGRIVFAVERYVQSLLPPFASALARYDREREYSWAARDIRTLFIPIRSRTSPRGTSERAGSRGG
jgi:arginine decarboxylase